MQDVVEEAVLDYGSEEFGNLGQIDMWILVQETVLIKQTVEDTSVNFLFLHNLRLLEALQSNDELLNSLIDLMGISAKDMLEILICGLVNFFRALSGTDLAWEENGVLSNQVFNLVLDILGDLDENILGLEGEFGM